MGRLRLGKTWTTVLLVGCILAVRPVRAAEPVREFLQGLKERGYYDMAVAYLEQMRTSRLAPVELKETLLYEMGSTLIEASRAQRDIGLREKQLDQAQDALQRFIGQHPEHPLRSSADSELGNLLVERARINVEQSKKSGSDKAKLADATKLYDDAYKVFARSQNDLKEKLEAMKVVAPNDKAKLELRDQLRAGYLQVQLLAAAVKEESADTYAKSDSQYNTLLTEAATQYDDIYTKYRTRLAGLYARMYQGRCNQKIGKLKEALSFYADLLEQPDKPDAFRTLKTKTLGLAAECWLDSKPPLLAEAVQRLEPWVADARPTETKTSEWLDLRLALARAQWALGEQKKKDKANDPEAKRLQTEAKKNVLIISKVPGDLQQEARKYVGDWGGVVVEDKDKPQPKTFAEAKQAGRDTLEAMQTAGLVLNSFPARIAQEKDPAEKKKLQEQLAAAQETAASAVDDAKRYFRLALRLADRDTNVADVNVVRYFLCFLHYRAEEFFESAVVGEFVARRYPDSAGARQCAKIAMASYLKLYGEDTSKDKQFSSTQIIAIANFVTEKWAGQPEALEALNTLIPFMIKAGDLDMAEKYLAEIPEDSPKRGDAEIKTGQAMWSAYLQGMQQTRKWESGDEEIPPGMDMAAKQAELVQLKSRAQRILEAGVERMRASGKVDQAAATAALSLAQLYVDTEQAEQAVTIMEDATVGPYVLVQKKSPVAQREGFDEETYKTTLRAYISSLSSASDPQAVVAKAEQVMDAMKDAVDQETRIKIYMSLARDLEQQMELASPAAKTALSKGFETFLNRLGSTATDLSVLRWVGETYYSLASGFDTSNQLTKEAATYYTKATETYERILKDKAYGDNDEIKKHVQRRLAVMKQRLGKFPDARDIYKDILTVSNTALDVQVDAAKMYQQWASFPGKEPLYAKAMAGAEPGADNKNIIWGWGKLSQITAKYKQYYGVFHESRYNLAYCRLKLADSLNGKERDEQLSKANRGILITQKTFGNGPDWEEWKPKYDALLKKIQAAMGEKATGFPKDKEDATVAKAKGT